MVNHKRTRHNVTLHFSFKVRKNGRQKSATSLPKVPTASLSSAEASLRREEDGERKIKKRAVDDKNPKDRTTGRAPAFFLLSSSTPRLLFLDKTRQDLN